MQLPNAVSISMSGLHGSYQGCIDAASPRFPDSMPLLERRGETQASRKNRQHFLANWINLLEWMVNLFALAHSSSLL
jgi:hypothetical protein